MEKKGGKGGKRATLFKVFYARKEKKREMKKYRF
jgi:hypothetical protein